VYELYRSQNARYNDKKLIKGLYSLQKLTFQYKTEIFVSLRQLSNIKRRKNIKNWLAIRASNNNSLSMTYGRNKCIYVAESFGVSYIKVYMCQVSRSSGYQLYSHNTLTPNAIISLPFNSFEGINSPDINLVSCQNNEWPIK